MEIVKVVKDRKQYMDLLFLADEQEDMIDKYINRGEMFIITDDDTAIAHCIITDEKNEVCELKSIAVDNRFHRKGYGKKLVKFVIDYYKEKFDEMIVGTGDKSITVPFYESCGFIISHRLENFIIDNYDHPIYENGVQLFDVVYLKIKLSTL